MKPSSNFDPCISSKEKVEKRLKSLVLGEGNELDQFLRKGEVSQAAQLALSVLKTANEKTDCGQALSELVKNLVRPSVIKSVR